MTEENIRELLCLNKIVTKEDLMYLYNIKEEEFNILLLECQNFDEANIWIFSRKYNIDLSVVKRLSEILDDNDLFMVYFYFLVLSKYGKVTPYVIDKLEGIRCVKYAELMEVYRTVDEYITPESSLENVVYNLVNYAELIFESAINMSEVYRSFILSNLKEFQNLKESLKVYDKTEDLPVNEVYQNKSFTGKKLTRNKTKKIQHLITKFKVRNKVIAS